MLLKKALLRKKGLRSPTSLIGEKRGVSHALIKKERSMGCIPASPVVLCVEAKAKNGQSVCFGGKTERSPGQA